MMKMETNENRDIKTRIRNLIADYMQSEGCLFAEIPKDGSDSRKKLAELLDVPKYGDGSGYNFNKFATNPVRFKNDEVD